MAIDRDTASAALRDIEGVQRKTRQAVVYGASSAVLIMWGVLCAVGYVLSFVRPRWADAVWIAIVVVGLVGGTWLRLRNRRARGARPDNRIIYGQMILIAFGFLWSVLLLPMEPRQMGIFWPTLVMFGYTVMGLWLGRFFTVCGLAVTALSVAGYFWIGQWFQLWMAAVMAASLIGGGLWLRRLRTLP